MRRLRSRLTYANIVSSLALFLVLTGGTAVALTGSNTVFSDDITNDEVRTGDVRDDNLSGGGLASRDVRPNALTSADVSALTGADVTDGLLGAAEFATSIPAAHVTGPQQNVPFTNPSQTPLAFDTERYDTASMHDTATNNSRLTAPVNGIYAVTAQLQWSQNSTGDRSLFLKKNGTTEIGYVESDASASATGQPPQEATTQVRLAAGDYVEVVVAQSTDPTTTLFIRKTNESTPEFSMTWLAPGPE